MACAGVWEKCVGRPFTCVFDAFRFGLWEHSPLYRAGVGRFCRAIARELASRADVRLVFLSPAGLENSIERFLQADDRLLGAEFLRFEPVSHINLMGRFKPMLVRSANMVLSPRMKTKLKGRFSGGIFGGYTRPRPAMRAALAEMVADGPTCYFSPYYDLPVWLDGIPGLLKVAYVHDIIPLRLPGEHLNDEAYPRRMADFAQRADLILTNSRFTRDDYLDYFPSVSPDRVRIALEGCDEHFAPQTEEAVLRVRQRYGVPEGGQYIQTLSTLEARKGVEDVLRAFVRCRELYGFEDLWLVLSGQKGWGHEPIFDIVRKHRDHIVLTGFVDDADVPPLLSGCMCFAYMSRYEGFGLPPLEAMRCGAPVVAAHATSVPEVVGDGGVLVAPGDVDGLARIFAGLYADPAKRADLRAAGLRQAEKFSWKRCAGSVVEAMREKLP